MIACANKTAGGTSGGATSATTAVISPATNALLLLAISFYDGGGDDPAAPSSVTGCNLTWDYVTDVHFDATAADFSRLWLYQALATNPVSGAVTIDFGATSLTRIAWVLDQVTGMDTGSPIVQSATAIGNTGTLTLTPLLAPFANSGNMSWGAHAVQGGNPTTFTAGAGFALTGKLETSTSFCNIAAEYQVADADPAMSWASASVFKSGAIGVEVSVPLVPPVPAPPLLHGRGAA